jgi:hypothetical protein
MTRADLQDMQGCEALPVRGSTLEEIEIGFPASPTCYRLEAGGRWCRASRCRPLTQAAARLLVEHQRVTQIPYARWGWSSGRSRRYSRYASRWPACAPTRRARRPAHPQAEAQPSRPTQAGRHGFRLVHGFRRRPRHRIVKLPLLFKQPLAQRGTGVVASGAPSDPLSLGI